jgi:hypothetical protein
MALFRASLPQALVLGVGGFESLSEANYETAGVSARAKSLLGHPFPCFRDELLVLAHHACTHQ